MKKYKPEEVRKKLRLYIVENFGTQTAAGEAWEMKTAYVSHLINGHRPIPEWLVEELGFERIKEEYYVRIK